MTRVATPSSSSPVTGNGHAHLEQIVAQTSAAVFIKDLDGRLLFANPAFEAITGLPVDSIIGRFDQEIFSAAEQLRVNDRRVVEEKRALDFEDVIVTARGPRTYLSHKFPLQDEHGRAYAVCGIATDITDRKRIEEALRAAALAVSATEGEGVLGELVRSLAAILRVDVAMIAIYVPGDVSRMRTLAVRLDGKALRNFEYALESSPCRHVVGRSFRFVGSGVHPEFPHGTLFSAKGMDSYAALPLVDSIGRPLGLIATMDRKPMQDSALAEAMLKIFAVRAAAEIERAATEDVLRASEASYRAIFEASEDAIFVHDWDTGAFVDANPKACRTHGYSVEEFRGLSLDDISAGVPPYTADDAAQWLARARTGEPVMFEWHRRNRDGSLHWDEVYLKAAEIAGTPRLLAFTREITARKLAEAQLRQAQRMEAIGHLTGGIAHDFNNLLTSIMGYVTLAAERVDDADPKVVTYLAQAGASCRRARDLIQQMLTFSRGGRGDPRIVVPAPLVHDSIKLLRASLPATIAFDIDLDDDVPPVMVDPVQLDQVLMNLAINARDAMRSSGEIRITLRRASIDAICTSCRATVAGEMVELAVSDSGPGIAQDVLERMFEPFFTTKEVGKGSGMGLSTVHGIVHRHHGHVVVVTAEGAGASFRILMPPLSGEAAGAARAAARSDERIPRADLKGRVAVIDDEAPVAAFLKELLAHWGLDAVTFGDARAALDAFRTGRQFDAVITDHSMPAMTGLDFARAVRASGLNVPVLLCTAFGDALGARDIEHAGVRAVLHKPIDATALLAELQTALSATS
jgi:PAS domain S-box-containing protein